MTRLALPLLASLALAASAFAELPKPLVTGLKDPHAVAVALDGRVFVAVAGEFGKDGDGAVLLVADGKATPFATGLDDPMAMVWFQGQLFVADRDRILRVDAKGKVSTLAPAKSFPVPPAGLRGLAVDEQGILRVGDLGANGAGVLYRVDPKGRVTRVPPGPPTPPPTVPSALLHDSLVHLLVLDGGGGGLFRLSLANGEREPLLSGFGKGGGLAWDWRGRLFLSDTAAGKVFAVPRPGEKPVLLAEGFQAPIHLCVDPAGKRVLVVDAAAGTLTALPAVVPGWEVDETPLPIEAANAFPELKWSGWDPDPAAGKVVPLRPIVLTHANDGSNRVFVATQRGVIHVFPNDPKATQTKVFLDVSSKVRYSDQANEEGFLGLAFHPKYKQNGEFFVFYTDKAARLINVVSRFRVSKDDPDRADPSSEERILSVKHHAWNHDGGTIVFGPDGFLYVALGDGGGANDPLDNGQKMDTLLGKVLRLDVDRKDEGKAYAIPKDNPFVGKDGARPEIWCLGLRNVWRMAFDPATGKLWAADVGQNLWEEINVLTAGGNYGWNLRESLHPFGAKGVGPRKDLIDPIWEYHHDVGKSITGGLVYRGKKLPELDGHYLYADYVTGKIWALRYDEAKGRVTANRPMQYGGQPILSFGEDEAGEAYFLIETNSGRGVFRFTRTK